MNVQQRAQLVRRVGGQVFLHAAQLIDYGVAALAHTRGFIGDLMRLDEVMHDLHAAGGGNHCPTNGNSRSHSQSMYCERHGC